MTVEVTFLPSRPPKGESLTVMVTDMVGGSIGVEARGSDTLVSQIVSATEALVKPAIQIISPACTSSTITRSVPLKVNNFVNRPFSILLPSKLMALTVSLTFARPCATRPIRHLPR